jgi:hypothetical protein
MDEADEIRSREPVARLPYPDPDSASEPVQEALAALPALNIFRMLAHAESALRPFLRFGGAILGGLELDPKLDRGRRVAQRTREGGAGIHVAGGRWPSGE